MTYRYYQIKFSRINMGGGWGKGIEALARQSIQWQNEYPGRSTYHKERNNPL